MFPSITWYPLSAILNSPYKPDLMCLAALLTLFRPGFQNLWYYKVGTIVLTFKITVCRKYFMTNKDFKCLSFFNSSIQCPFQPLKPKCLQIYTLNLPWNKLFRISCTIQNSYQSIRNLLKTIFKSWQFLLIIFHRSW